MTIENLSPAMHAHLLASAKERAHALRRAAVNAWLDAMAHRVHRAARAVVTRARSAVRAPRTHRQLEA